jgi:hypothetical protein
MIHRLFTTVAALALVGAFALAQPTVDGTIAEGEYANTLAHEESGAMFYWTVDGLTLHMAYTMPANGWAGIGWAGVQTNRKAGFDEQIVTMEGDTAVVLDYYQESARGAPELDTDMGGTNSFTESVAMHADGVWTVEFTRPLATGEETDVDIVPGVPMTFMLAHSNVMDLSRQHPRDARWYIEDFTF